MSRSSPFATFPPEERGRCVEHHQVLGPQLLGDAMRVEVRRQVRQREFARRAELDERAHPLAEDGVGPGHGRGQRDGRVGGDLVLDLPRR